MSNWEISIDDGPGVALYGPAEIRVAVTGILMGGGLAVPMAETFGKQAVDAAQHYDEQRRMHWDTKPLEYRHQMSDGRVILLRSKDLPEDPTRRCDGYTTSGDHCGRSMNHRGEC